MKDINKKLDRLEDIIEFGLYNLNPDKKVALAIVRQLKTASKPLTNKQAVAIAERNLRVAKNKA